MKRIYHNIKLWEDYNNGMYKKIKKSDEEIYIEKACSLLKDKKLLKKIMKLVITNWKYSSEVNLTNNGCNQQAWLGQASCCYLYKVPEYLTKEAWNLLSINEQNIANNIADKIILEWKNANK